MPALFIVSELCSDTIKRAIECAARAKGNMSQATALGGKEILKKSIDLFDGCDILTTVSSG